MKLNRVMKVLFCAFLFLLTSCTHRLIDPEEQKNKLMAVAALSDLVETFEFSESVRDQGRYWYVVDADPEWVNPYFVALLEKKKLNVALGSYEKLSVSKSGKLFVPLEYSFSYNGEEWVAALSANYAEKELRLTRAYSNSRPLTSTLKLVKEKDTMWRTPVVN